LAGKELCRHIQHAVSSSAVPRTTEIWSYQWESSEGLSSKDSPGKMIKGLFSLENIKLRVDFIQLYINT